MLSPRKQALVVDIAIGITAVAFATLTRGTPRSFDGFLIATLGAVVFGGTIFVAEHTDLLAAINRTRPMSLVLAAVVFTAVGVAIIVGQGVVAVPSATLLWGMGVGLIGYRVWFGLYRTVPTKRRKQAKLWGTPPERGDPGSRRER